MNRAQAAAIALAAMFVAACSPSPLDLGSDTDILWWTNNTSLEDWSSTVPSITDAGTAADAGSPAGSTSGKQWEMLGGILDLVPTPVRSPPSALSSTVYSPGEKQQSEACVERAGLLPEAYYSAWYYVPAFPTSTKYWLFSQFRSVANANDPTTNNTGWDLDFQYFQCTGDGGKCNDNLQFALFNKANNADELPTPNSPTTVPLGRWFQVETYLRATSNLTDSTGQLTIWVDGIQIFDIKNRITTASYYVQWNVGAIAEVLSPAPQTFFVDDAAISKRRLGPDFPPFQSGN